MKYFTPFFLLVISACGSDDAPTAPVCDPTGINITLIASSSGSCGTREGTLEVEATGESGNFQYRIDVLNFQPIGIFNNLTPAKYIITAKDSNECTNTLEVILESDISFNEKIKPIIDSSCATAGCHVAGAQAPNLTIESNIFSAAPRIKSQVETGAMPFGENLTLAEEEIQNIICWFNDGAPNN
ncbi:MAG: hypothetical protein RIF33_07100 [Cyclobacteriaceae bacterium]